MTRAAVRLPPPWPAIRISPFPPVSFAACPWAFPSSARGGANLRTSFSPTVSNRRPRLAGDRAFCLPSNFVREVVMPKTALLTFVGFFLILAADEYTLGPASLRQPNAPKGSVTQHSWTSKIFPGTARLLGVRAGSIQIRQTGVPDGVPGWRRIREGRWRVARADRV